MDGDVEDVTIIKELYGGVTIASGNPVRKKQGHPYSAKTPPRVKRLNAETNTDKVGNTFIKNNLHIPSYIYKAQVILTTVKPTLQECGYINSMSKDTRYFAQTLRKYPLPKPKTKSSDLIQEKIRRAENKPVSANRKTASKRRNVRKTASHQAIKSNIVFECNVQDTQRLSKVEEILPASTKIENNSGNEVRDYEYNYLNSKTKLSNLDVRYCTSTKRACTCRRMKNVCTRPENCPNDRHRLDHHRQFYHDKRDEKKPSCHCNVCQASREAPSTSRLSPSEYANFQGQDEEVQLLSRNYLESSHDVIDFEKEIRQWTETKLTNDDVVQIKLIQKLAKALGGFSKDEGFSLEAKHEVVKYLTALSVIDPSIKDKLNHFADDLLNNLSKSLKNTKSLRKVDANNNDNLERNSLYQNDNNSKLRLFIKHLLNQLPIEKYNKNNDQLDTVVEKFINILQENEIKQINLRDSRSTDQYKEKDYYLNRILSWYKSIPELEQKLQVQIYDNIRQFQDLANKLSELNNNIGLKENIVNVKVEIMQWLKNYLNIYNFSQTESLKENLNDKLVTKLVAPIEEKIYCKGLTEKVWITQEIYFLLEDMNHEIHHNNDVLELANSLVTHLSYIKEKNNGSLTLYQCQNELKSWFEYLEKHNVHFQENDKMELECKILSRIKVLLKHEKHKNWYHLKILRLLPKVILEEISRSVIDNKINISQENLLNLITDVVSMLFETCINEKLVSKNVYEKVCTVINFILNLHPDDIKGLVKSILDKIISTWKNVAKKYSKENSKIEDNGLRTNYPSNKAYKSQFATSTPRNSEKGFLSNFGGDSTDFSHLLNANFLQKVIRDWLEENQLKLNEVEKQNIIKSITNDIVCRYNYAKAFSKTISDLEEIEHLKYFVFKILGDYVKEQEINNVMSTVSKLHQTIDKTLLSDENLGESKVSNKSQVPLEVLKTNLVKAFINLNSYLVDETFKNEYKGKLKEEINKFCSQYFQRFPATPLDTEQLHSNIYNALDNVPKPPLTKSEFDIITQVKNWLDELCKENNLPNDNENIVLDLANPLLQKKVTKSILYDSENEISKTISQWVQNYSGKQKKSINAQYWTQKLVEKLKELDTFQDLNLSKPTSEHMYTIPAAESLGAQVDESILKSEDNNEILAKDLLSAEDREFLSRIKDRSPVPDNIVKSQTDFVGDKPEHELVPDVRVREYHWESNEQTQTSRNTLPLDEIDELTPGCIQPQAKGNDYEDPEIKVPDVRVREYHWESNEHIQISRNTLPPEEIEELTPGCDQPQGKGKDDEGPEKKVPDGCVREYHWESNEQTQTSRNILPPDEIDELTPGCVQPQGKGKDDEGPERKVPDVRVREYHWQSNEQTQSFRNTQRPDEIDELTPGCVQPQGKGKDDEGRMKFADNCPRRKSDERNVDKSMIPEKLKKTKYKNKTCKFRKRSTEPSRVVCPNKFTVKSKSFDKGVPCSCSDCVINEHRIKYYCKKSEIVDLQNCPECFGGYCPFPSCAYFE